MYVTTTQKNDILELVRKRSGVDVVCKDIENNGDYSRLCFAVELADHSELILQFSLSELPGCCGVVVSHGTWIKPEYRAMGIGKELSKIKMDIARYWGYTLMICTDRNDNTPQRRILKNNGWETVDSFVNLRTGNLINIDIKYLQDKTIDKIDKKVKSGLTYPFKYILNMLKNKYRRKSI